MSWALRRRLMYLGGILLFFGIVVGVPLFYKFATIPPTCSDGIQNQGETDADRGGPCPLVDVRALSPVGTLWTRVFRVRDGSYNAVAYVQNPNEGAGVAQARYRFRLYDAANVLVAEREGTTFLMPGGVTPIFEGGIPTGNRIASRAFFDFLDEPVWEKFDDASKEIVISNKQSTDMRIEADVRNTSVGAIADIEFVAVVFDTVGNAFTASATVVPRLSAGEETKIVFTWPDPFPLLIGRIDIIALVPPTGLSH